MANQHPDIVEQVHLEDPILEVELFGEMDPALEAEMFGSYEESDTTLSSSDTSISTAATSPSSQATTSAPDLNDEALNAQAAQKCFDKDAAAGAPQPSKLVKSSLQLDREDEKRLKLERRTMALKKKEAAKHAPTPATTTPGAGLQKRKRGDDEEGAEQVTKRELTDAAAAEMKQQPPAPATTGAQKRKRGGDDEGEDRGAKRGLTDTVAAEIGQRRDHAYCEDLEKVDARRDSLTEGSVEGIRADGAGRVEDGTEKREQHLAPPTVECTKTGATNDLAITEDDDEMTRMLKEELMKPYFEVYVDNEPEPEDPRITEILQPLTEPEKLKVVHAVWKHQKHGKADLTNRKLENAVEMALKSRRQVAAKKKAAQEAHAPKKTSPLANDGGKAEEQKIERRPKLAPKSRKTAPKAEDSDAIAPTTTSTSASTSIDDGDALTTPSHVTTSLTASSSTGPVSPETDGINYEDLKLPKLKEICKRRGLIVAGNKKDLLKRLVEADADEAAGRVPKGLKGVPKKKKKKHVPM